MSDLSDKLLTVINTVARKRDEKIPYDKTLSCQVVDSSEAANYKYIVSYQGAEFTIRSERTDLKDGDWVYVKTVNNNPSAERLIIGKKIMEQQVTPRALEYENFVKVTPNLNINYGTYNDQKTLIANGATEGQLLFSYIETEGYFAGYTKMGLKFSLSTCVEAATSGTFGLRIRLYCIDQSTSSGVAKNFTTLADFTAKDFYFNISDLVSVNPYNSLGYCNQSKMFDINNLLIKKVEVYLYQGNDFFDENNMLLEVKDSNTIKIDMVSLSFGYHKEAFTDSRLLYLYTEDGLNYNADNPSKTLAVRWVDTDGKEYEPGEGLKLYVYDSQRATINAVLNEWYYSEADGLNRVLDSLSTVQGERYKAAIYYKGKYQKSNEVVFTNTRYNSSAEALALITGLTTDFDKDENNGIYYIYGQDNLLLNAGEADTVHYIRVHYASTASARTISPGDIISWKFSKSDTMIDEPRSADYPSNTAAFYTINEVGDFWVIRHEIMESEISKPEFSNESPFFALPFRIKNFYSAQNTKNSIYITYEFVQDGIENSLETTQQLLFGSSGSQGADYIFTLSLIDKSGYRVPALTKGSTDVITIKPTLYDYNQKEIDISDATITYSWYYKDNNCLNLYNNNQIQLFDPDDSTLLQKATKNIISAEITYKNTTLIAYLPIAIRDGRITRIDGASTVTYEITGKKPQYYKAPYKLYSPSYSGRCYWHAMAEDSNKQGYPAFADDCLQPASIYEKDLGAYTVFAVSKEAPDGRTDYDWVQPSDILWIQPILITQNRYPSAMWNNESNELTFNSENSKIETTMVGRVQTNNKALDGVFMGILGEKDDGGIWSSTFGLYGYKGNQQIFNLDENGELKLFPAANNIKITRADNETPFEIEAPTNIAGQLTLETDANIKGDLNVVGDVKLDIATIKNLTASGTLTGTASSAKDYTNDGKIKSKFDELEKQIKEQSDLITKLNEAIEKLTTTTK